MPLLNKGSLLIYTSCMPENTPWFETRRQFMYKYYRLQLSLYNCVSFIHTKITQKRDLAGIISDDNKRGIIWFVTELKVLSVTEMKKKEFGRKRLWSNWSVLRVFVKKYWVETRIFLLRVAGDPAWIRNKKLPNQSLRLYRYTSPFGTRSE